MNRGTSSSSTARGALAAAAVLAVACWSAGVCDPVRGEGDELGQAARLLQAGRSAEAAALYAERLAARPGDGEAVEGRIRALLAQDRWREALAEARRHHEEDPAERRVRSALGEALFRAGLLERAQELLEPFAADEHAPPRALMTLGRLRVARGDYDGLGSLVGRALARAPEDRSILLWASEVAESRSVALDLLERYLERSAGDDAERIEAAKGKRRLFRELGDRPTWVRTRRPERLEIPLKLVWDEQGRGLGYVVELRLGNDGRPVRVLLDTGSSGLFLLHRIARKSGFRPLAQDTVFGGGGDLRHSSHRGIIPVLAVGDLRFSDALVNTTKRELEPYGRYHGLLGISIFEGYAVTLDLARQRLVLAPPAESFGGSEYWDLAGQILVRAETTGGRDGLFLFDTGAAWSILGLDLATELAAATLGPKAEIRSFGGLVEGARVVRGVQLGFQGLSSGTESLRAVDLSLRSRLGRVEISGYLGLDLLEGTRIEFDTTRHRVKVSRTEE